MRIILIPLFFFFAACAFGQTDTLNKNKDTLYTCKRSWFIRSRMRWHFVAYYPGTKIVRHKYRESMSPDCNDCTYMRRTKDWEYDEKGQLTKFYKEKKRTVYWEQGRPMCRSVTKTYENGKLVNVERENCDHRLFSNYKK